MKKRMKNIICILAMIVSMASYANTDYSLSAKKGSTVLSLTNVKKGHELLIKDTNLLVLYRETIQKSGNYSKGFDLTALPDGNYFFELVKDVKIVIIPFVVASNQVTFDKENETIIYKPTVRTIDHKLYVSRLSFEAQPMTVEIYFEEAFTDNTSLIFSEDIEKTKIASRIYELSKKKKGDYTIVFKTQGRRFTEHIKF